MAEILDSDDDSVCDLTEHEVIDLSADDNDLAAQLNAQLDEYIVIDSDSDDDDVQFVSQSPPKRRKVDEEEVTFVKSTPPAAVHDVDADEALARKLHEQINGDVEVVARPTPASKPAKKKAPSSKKRPKNEGPFGGRDVLKKQRTGLFDFLSKKAKSLRIVDVVPNPHSEPGKPLYERFLSAYTFAKTKKVGNGECDAFLSHSWRDDAPSKWKKMIEFKSDYEAKHGGDEPRCWLDKACIDQDGDINASLRALPIYLLGSRYFVVFVGESYFNRMWCVLELFTFVRSGGTVDQIMLKPLHGDDAAAAPPARRAPPRRRSHRRAGNRADRVPPRC